MASNGTSANPTRPTKGRPVGLDMKGTHAKPQSTSMKTGPKQAVRRIKTGRR